ncbi:hypothetical protein DHEL01_v202669 [Diaporthe helianthi]|uniref:Transcription factor domain-containing protein n=1 Tax=Diaporthe helianthi TaxID=158607 RepID=A0A2P5I8U3_DIAHE|nr:hypothetical protein DHEL01_v202669 [Diaporthe helianthi]
MSSLQSIMNVDEDQHDASSSTDKKDKDPSTPASGFRSQNPSSSSIPPGHVIRSSQQSSSTELAEGSRVTHSSRHHADDGSSSSSAVRQDERRAVAIHPRDRNITATAPATFRTDQPRRESNTSVDSMDQHGYGSAGGTSGGGLPPNHPRRPMGSPNPEVPIRLTPITGRVSRAKKGVPVHTEQEGDKISGENSRRDSTASGSAPLDDQMSGLQVGGALQPPHGFSSPPSFGGPPASASPSDIPPSTPNLSHTPYAPGGSPGNGPAMSPPGDEHYGPSSNTGPRYPMYTDRLPIISQPGSMSSSPVPRTVPLFVSSENQSGAVVALHTSLDQPPELIHAECSPWTSSESNYSTPPPADMGRPRRYWQPQHRAQGSFDWQHNADMLSPFSTQREVHGTGSLDTVTASHFGSTPFTMPPHLAPAPYQTYGPLLDPSLIATFDDQTQQSLLDTSMTSQYIAHHRSSSVRSPSHPSSPGLAADALVAPAALPSRAAPLAHVSRQKEVPMSRGSVVGAVGIYTGDGSSPSWPSNSPGDILTGSALAGVGGCGSGGMTVGSTLSRPVRNSISSYLNVYWNKFHTWYPFIHRSAIGDFGEDALKCAMAAIATQFLDNKEDRIRGNVLHEFAWQEARRHTQYSQYSQWSLPVKQAIVLCELFARFRGRKASVRPSKLFENLYSRVSRSESLVSSVSDKGRSSICVSRSDSSSIPSLSSSAGVFSPSLPVWSPPSSEPASASSPRNGFYQFDHTRHGSNSVFFSPIVSFTPQQTSSSSPPDTINLEPGFQAYNSVSFNNIYYPFSSVGQEQSYSNSFSPQVLETTQTMFNATSLGHSAMDISSSSDERWQAWIDEEGCRRLLAVCFSLDNHTSLFHQQPRARDEVDPTTIPLTGHADALWAASSATEWANILESTPGANTPRFVPPSNTLTPEEIGRHTCFDQVILLHAEASRLPRRQYNCSSTDLDDHSDFAADDLRTPTTTSYNLNFSGAYSEDRLVHLFSMARAPPGPSIYLALHHTPLHDLLAVSGDSWVFSQKVLGASTFSENQKRLRAWAEGRPPSKSPSTQQQASAGSLEGMSCAQATCYASRALLGFLEGDDPTTPQAGCISDYWGMYVCALIIWAFGQKAARSPSSSSPQKTPLSEDEAISWLRSVALAQRPEDAARTKHRREASAGVVSLVKRRLAVDCVGPRSQLYVDAVGVLKKLEEGVNWRWF